MIEFENVENNTAQIAELLLRGKVALLPTDTVYGLAACPGNDESVNDIFKIKARPRQKNLPVLVSNIQMLESLDVDINANIEKLFNSPYIPGPLTVVAGISYRGKLTSFLNREEVAFRIPNHRLLLAIIDITGPLLVTSANVSGNNTMENTHQIIKQFSVKLPDVVVDDGQLGTISSTIINCRSSIPKIERRGVVDKIQLEEYLNVVE